MRRISLLIILFGSSILFSKAGIKSWKRSSWFGYFYETQGGWTYTEKFEWIYPESSISDENMWFYTPDIEWCWMDLNVGNFFYSERFQEWVYCNEENLFYDFELSQYFSFDEYFRNNWRLRLFTPTQITKTSHGYFIVDCWHHRILFSKKNHSNLFKWQVIDDNVAGPHSIISIGNKIVYEDTGRGNLITKTFDGDIFSQSNIINGIGVRPHKIIYDSENNLSLVLNSGNRTLSLVDFDSKDHKLVNTLDLDFLGDTYSRSISLINGLLYFASGPNQITETIYDKDSIFVVGKYPVPEGFESMNDIFKSSNGWIYFTATSNSKIVRAKSFSEFSKGDYEDISDILGIEGNPYYLSEFDQKVYVTEIAESSAIIWFKDNIGSEIIEFGRLMDFGAPNKQDFLRKALLPL